MNADREPNSALIHRFSTHQALRGFSKRTIERRRATARAVIALAGGIHLCDITVDHVEAFLAKYPCAQTRQSFRSDINQLYRFLIQRGFTTGNPCDLIATPRIPTRAATPLTAADVRRAIAAADPTARLMIMLGAYAGLRGSEIARLRGEDIDLEGRIIVVRQGKGGKDGVIPMADELATELQAWPHRGRIFTCSPSRSAVYGRIKRVFNQLDIDARPHDLRHSYGTQAAKRSNGNMRAVQQLMRHESLRSTERYIRYNPPGGDIVTGLYDEVA